MTAPTIDSKTIDRPAGNFTSSGQAMEIAQAQEQFTLSIGLQQSVLVSGSFFYELEETDGEFVAMEPRTGTYGEADSASDAVVSLLRSLAALRTELRAHDGKLSPELAADLEFLDQILWV